MAWGTRAKTWPWGWRHVDGRLEEWTEDRALAYLAAGLESHLRPQKAVPVAITINKRSARAAMKPNAQRRGQQNVVVLRPTRRRIMGGRRKCLRVPTLQIGYGRYCPMLLPARLRH